MECFAKFFNSLVIDGSRTIYSISEVFSDSPNMEILRSFVTEFATYLVKLNLGIMVYQISNIITYAMRWDENHFIASSDDEYYFFCPFVFNINGDSYDYRIVLRPCINNGTTLSLSLVQSIYHDERETF